MFIWITVSIYTSAMILASERYSGLIFTSSYVYYQANKSFFGEGTGNSLHRRLRLLPLQATNGINGKHGSFVSVVKSD